MVKLSEEEKKELTEVQKMAKAALDAQLKGRKTALMAELKALENIDTEEIVRGIGEKKEESPSEGE